jgi:hypothetical protein
VGQARAFLWLLRCKRAICRKLGARAVIGALAVVSVGCERAENPRVQQGKASFRGDVPLEAHMAGHTTLLPTSVVRCKNCHQTTAPAPSSFAQATGGERPGQSFGPILNRATLTEARRRRGGPPSKYDASTFCRLLNEGVDPAHVIIPMTMPRYRASQDECDALWEYLVSQ